MTGPSSEGASAEGGPQCASVSKRLPRVDHTVRQVGVHPRELWDQHVHNWHCFRKYRACECHGGMSWVEELVFDMLTMEQGSLPSDNRLGFGRWFFFW